MDWAEVTAKRFDPQRYTVRNTFRRLAQKQDPWAGIAAAAASLRGMRDRLGAR